VKAEAAYMHGMCAVALGNKEILERALRFVDEVRANRTYYYGRKEKPFLDGAICELKGDFIGAARQFEKHLELSPDRQLVLKHLAAVKKERRRGEV
ncbi:MAG: hypothetical protein HQ559_00260, partial [Lentisphaerae bacterium]|nr:hypothetical protein [Lentisphaerota bacterium]